MYNNDNDDRGDIRVSLREGRVGEGIFPALAFQDGQVPAHAGDVDDPTGAAPVVGFVKILVHRQNLYHRISILAEGVRGLSPC